MEAVPYIQIRASGWKCYCHSETCSIISVNRWLIFPDLSISVLYLREGKPKQTKIRVSWHPALFHLSVPKPMTTHKAEQETFCTSHLALLGFVFSLASKFRMSPKEHRSARLAFSLSRDHQCLTLSPCTASQEVMAWALLGGTPPSVGSLCCSALPSWQCHNKHTAGRGKIQESLCPYNFHEK